MAAYMIPEAYTRSASPAGFPHGVNAFASLTSSGNRPTPDANGISGNVVTSQLRGCVYAAKSIVS